MNHSRSNRRFTVESLERRELMTVDPGWAFALSGPVLSDTSSDIALAPDGNLLVTGAFRGAIDFDPGAGAQSVTTNQNAQEGFVAKYTPERGLIWSNTFGGLNGGHEYSQSIGTDATGDVYIAGHTGTATPKFGSLSFTNQGSYDSFVAKIDGATGAYEWVRGIGGADSDLAFDLSVSPTGDVYVAGRYGGTVDFDPSPSGTFWLTSAGDFDAYFMKLDTNGNFQWARSFGGPTTNNGHRIVLDGEGNAYAAGTMRETTDFGNPGEPMVLEDTSPGFSNLFLVKLDEATGASVWARQADGDGRVSATRLAADGNGNLYLAGVFEVTATFGAGSPTLTSAGGEDGFISRWDTDGNFAWASHVAAGAGAGVSPGEINFDAAGDLLYPFAFEGTADFDPGVGVANLTSSDQADGAILKLHAADGSFASVKQIAGPGRTDVDVVIEDAAGNQYVNGYFENSVNMTTGETLTVSNTTGTFLGKIAVAAPTKFFVVDGTADNTHEYDAGGNRTDNYALNSANSNPRGAASNVAGDKVWVIDANKKVYVYNNAGGLLGSWTANGLSAPTGITTNGTDIWIVDSSTDKVYKYAGAATRLSGSQNAASNFNLNNQNGNATDLVTNGTNIWTVNSAASDKVFRYNMTGTLQGSWTIDSRNTSPTGITLDPASSSALWIVDNATDQVFAYAGATTRTSGSQSASIAVNLGLGNSDPQGIADPPAFAGQPLLTLEAQPTTKSTARHFAADHVFDALFGSMETPAPKRARRLATTR
jgi:hypothetical protein